jgi:hypothetical protein
MKMQRIDSLDENSARKFTGCKVIDQSGESVGTADGFWMDPSTRHVEFLGVKSSWSPGKVHVVPAGDVKFSGQGHFIRVGYPATVIRKAPTFYSRAELAQVEKEQINAYFGRLISLRRISSIEEIRPEEAINSGDAGSRSEQNPEKDRLTVEGAEQGFFNQKGFVTDSMHEVDASKELGRMQREAKVRNREDRIKRGSLD